MNIEAIFRNDSLHSAGLFISLQEAENKMRMMQQKLRQEEKDLMWSSCETTRHTVSGHTVPECFGLMNSVSCSER